MIGSEGVAAVVDPQSDVDLYLDAAREHGLTISHVESVSIVVTGLERSPDPWAATVGRNVV